MTVEEQCYICKVSLGPDVPKCVVTVTRRAHGDHPEESGEQTYCPTCANAIEDDSELEAEMLAEYESRKDVAEVLREAAAAIRSRGWQQGVFGSRFCAITALVFAGGSQPVVNEAYTALKNVIKCDKISDWNDAPGRTAEEVIGALEQTAEAVLT